MKARATGVAGPLSSTPTRDRDIDAVAGGFGEAKLTFQV
jgi:hypothetical protein